MYQGSKAGLVVGVDTHLETHTAALCDARGRVEAQLQVPATAAGYEQLPGWARQAASGRDIAWAVEGTRHYGLGLARHLAGQGEQVVGTVCERVWPAGAGAVASSHACAWRMG